MKKRIIPVKNYFILLLILIAVILLSMYITSWFRINQKQNLPKGAMNGYLKELKIEEIENFVVENPNIILYVSSSDNEEIVVVENKIKEYIKEKNISDSFVYLDTKDLDNETIEKEFSKIGKAKEHVYFIKPNVYSIKEGTISAFLYENERPLNAKETIKFIEKQEMIK